MFLVTVGALAWLFWSIVLGFVDGPIIGPLDTGQYGFTGHYLWQNLSWLPAPHVALESDWTHFPYGADHVFLHWAFERDLTFGLLNAALGPGPWFQLYFLMSMSLTAIGSYLLLRTTYRPSLAAAAGLVIGFCNFYSIRKFPAHMPHSVVHWTVLGIVLDAVLTRRLVRGRRIPIHLGILRIALLALSLGLELGYIAGFSLLSFCITSLWLIGVVIRRWIRDRGRPTPLVRDLSAAIRSDLSARPWLCLSAAAMTVLAAWLYVPLSTQIVKSVRQYDTPRVEHRRWENPARLLIPYLPGLNPETIGDEWLGDRGENWGFHFSPGLSLTLLALLGIVRGWRRWQSVVPTLTVLMMCVLFHPSRLPTLHLFPWFEFARVPGRATAIFPALLVILALAGWPRSRPRRLSPYPAAALAGLLLVETGVAYHLVSHDRMSPSSQQLVRPDEAFWKLMQAIRDSPGQALLEWPFAISAGGKLAIYQGRLMGVNQLAQFHHKKVIGAHFGRPHARSAAPLVDAGWPHLFLPAGSPDGHGRRGYAAQRQRRDFVAEEWDFVEKFFELNDFCGVLLFADLLPEATVSGYHSRFGEPLATANLTPGAGRIEFISKPSAMRIRQDPKAGKRLRLQRPVFELRMSERVQLGSYEAEELLGDGWLQPRKGARLTSSKRATLVFGLERVQDLTVTVMASGFGRQRVMLELNGVAIGSVVVADENSQPLTFKLDRALMAEVNTLALDFPNARQIEGRRGTVTQAISATWILFRPSNPIVLKGNENS